MLPMHSCVWMSGSCRINWELAVRPFGKRWCGWSRNTSPQAKPICSKKEIVDLIIVWAALEGMAARLATQHASDEDIAALRKMFPAFSNGDQPANIDEYSERNIEFHQSILKLGGCQLLVDMANQLFLHVRSIRAQTIGEADRATRSVKDHRQIVEAIEARDTELAERLVREHALDLAKHIDKNVTYLD